MSRYKVMYSGFTQGVRESGDYHPEFDNFPQAVEYCRCLNKNAGRYVVYFPLLVKEEVEVKKEKEKMSKYKVGDRVIVKKGMRDEDTPLGVVDEMRKFEGKEVEITEVGNLEGNPYYRIKQCDYRWDDSMFQGVATKYNVGDKVVIKSKLEQSMQFGINDEMKKEQGKTLEITSVGYSMSGKCTRYTLAGSIWNWSEEMFDGLATEEKAESGYKFLIIDHEFTDDSFEVTEERLNDTISKDNIEWLKARACVDGIFAKHYPLDEITVIVALV